MSFAITVHSDSEEELDSDDSDLELNERRRKSDKETKKRYTMIAQNLQQYLQKVNELKIQLQVERMQVLQMMNEVISKQGHPGKSAAAISTPSTTVTAEKFMTEENINKLSLDLNVSDFAEGVNNRFYPGDADDEMGEDEIEEDDDYEEDEDLQ